MDGLSACMIDTRIVYGFKGAGKTSYIKDCIRNDFFYKYGKTLILCFERGEEEYDAEALLERNASVVYCDDRTDIGKFCEEMIQKYNPDRIYAEMNTELPMLRKKLPGSMNITSTVTWIDWSTLDMYFINRRQMISQMVSESQQVTFRGCPSKDLLAPYGQEFKLINNRASYLRQDPMGYHEKAFDLFVPYSLDDEMITIGEKEFLVLWLDSADHPENYDGKRICFNVPLELRKAADDSMWSAGRVVMTCCMSDLQFMSFELTDYDTETFQGGWISVEAIGRVTADKYGRKVLKLEPVALEQTAGPRSGILMTGNVRRM